jgi:hypothetical protein
MDVDNVNSRRWTLTYPKPGTLVSNLDAVILCAAAAYVKCRGAVGGINSGGWRLH